MNLNMNMNDEEINPAQTVDKILQMTCGITLADELSKDPNERDEELTAFLSATCTTFPQMQMHEMKDVYHFRAREIKKEISKQRIAIWNPLSLLMNPTIDEINDATLVVEQLKVLSGTDPSHCRILVQWVKDRAEKISRETLFASDATCRDFFYKCLFHMKNFIHIMIEEKNSQGDSQQSLSLHQEFDNMHPIEKDEYFQYYMRVWMRKNWTNPYPSYFTYNVMSMDTGIDKETIKQWLGNFRARIWKKAYYLAFHSSNTYDFIKRSFLWGYLLDSDCQKYYCCNSDSYVSELISSPKKRARTMAPCSAFYPDQINSFGGPSHNLVAHITDPPTERAQTIVPHSVSYPDQITSFGGPSHACSPTDDIQGLLHEANIPFEEWMEV